MFAPKLYTIRKIPFIDIWKANDRLQLGDDEWDKYNVRQQDSMLLRQIRLITYDESEFNKYIVFVDCAGGKTRQAALKKIIHNGFKINKQEFVMSERSASMVRQGILSFVDKRIASELTRRITMDIDMARPQVIAKIMGYRGLMLSSCHCIEGWVPKIIIVPDCFVTIPNQTIKYAYDNKIKYKDKKTGEEREWTQKDIAQKTTDVRINAFDGCGIAHPDIMREFERRIGADAKGEKITSMIFRGPYLKGCISEMDYVAFYQERGVKSIKDIWGVEHSVEPDAEPMCILLESMYKGMGYFKTTGTYTDWQDYWKAFKKYNHCIGIAKWNFGLEQEPLSTRVNYQVLQDLEMPFEDFRTLSNESVEWYEKITNGDSVYTYCFLGMKATRHKALNNYCEAILKNPEMLKEEEVRGYIRRLLNKYQDEFKCGKLWMNCTFKFAIPDLIMFMEHVAGLPLKGCLESDEFYSFDRRGIMSGERLIERNPHISKSEHVILKATNNELTQKYFNHLVNAAVINCKSITPQRLNGADFDGDILLVIDNNVMMSGVDRNAPIVIDIEDKATSLKEQYNEKNISECVIRGLKSSIGEISNYATAYHNRGDVKPETAARYEKYVDVLSLINGRLFAVVKPR